MESITDGGDKQYVFEKEKKHLYMGRVRRGRRWTQIRTSRVSCEFPLIADGRERGKKYELALKREDASGSREIRSQS